MPDDRKPSEREALHGQAPDAPGTWHLSEQSIMEDGQLDPSAGPQEERVNPEGTIDISRPIDRPFRGA